MQLFELAACATFSQPSRSLPSNGGCQAVPAGLDEGLVQELAYQLFLSTCGYECSPDNLQAIRRHLQVWSVPPVCWLHVTFLNLSLPRHFLGAP